ncbi:low specificity L-threonine aldolase [Intestinimonas massiliensis (ex Afouda et al. 2020)]|uniref:low specificity L-threonine aldolase n=1 Tax=Intestinimonas massiliensis (ex Afouda et al. 2020) TaxID=1673721 RepID=UPI0034A04B0D
MKYLFRNDYSFGAHPKVLTALAETSMEGNAGYGEDGYCKRCADLIRGLCNCPQADVQFLIGGTQTNFTAIAAFLRPWEGVIAADSSHINGHEVGAVEATGHKILPVPTGPDGKITPEQIAPILERHKDPHLVKPRLVEIADATESGMVYTKAELTALSQFCREHDLLLFLDGARLGSALASPASDLTLPDLAELTDAFYIGEGRAHRRLLHRRHQERRSHGRGAGYRQSRSPARLLPHQKAAGRSAGQGLAAGRPV